MIAKIKKLVKDYKIHLTLGGLGLLVIIVGLYIKRGDCVSSVKEEAPVEVPAEAPVEVPEDTSIVVEAPVAG